MSDLKTWNDIIQEMSDESIARQQKHIKSLQDNSESYRESVLSLPKESLLDTYVYCLNMSRTTCQVESEIWKGHAAVFKIALHKALGVIKDDEEV